MRLKHCHCVYDFRRLAKKRLPSPIFHYIDGAADDEKTCRQNTQAFDNCDLVPNVLRGVDEVDLSTTVVGQPLDMPLFLSPTALQRLFHYEGELAVGRAAEQFGTMFGLSSLGTVSIEEISTLIKTPKLFQLYVHKDKGLTRNMIDRCKAAHFNVMALTVDTPVGGNRERDLVTGFTVPPKPTLRSLISFAFHPVWVFNYLFRQTFELPQLQAYLQEGTSIPISVANYFNTMLDQPVNWQDAEALAKYWGKPFIIKGIMSVEDAQKAVGMGAEGIMVSNHGGRQLDGSRSPFDQLAEIVDAVGDKIDVICDGGIRRGTHVLKALSLGAKACSGGRLYLYALAAAGQAGVEKALSCLHAELVRDMKLMGCKNVQELNRNNLRFR